ncbi:outer membrane protein [Tropicimonas sediminicola]|uniref:Opacity protein n=1 Tax=Tropicimonas sediminicola TaxID=1031541 RepID=A0A239GZ43_9RHOB|nr:outer membrane beta-barrel protein [Tropicimonas sediminicola]SNS74068.1 Opacity protein [Tropicimonas sediminicola]
MNTFAKRALGATVGLSLAAPAFAGSLAEPVIEPAPAPAPVVVTTPSNDWTGGYAGLQLGYGELTDNLEGDDVIGGVRAGYDWDLGNWVVGLGAEANFGKIETDAGDLDSLSTLRVRGGYDFGRTMVYGVTGASYAASEDLNDSWGYFGGIGVETMVTDSVSLSGEIAAHRFDDYQDFGRVDATTATIGVNYRF